MKFVSGGVGVSVYFKIFLEVINSKHFCCILAKIQIKNSLWDWIRTSMFSKFPWTEEFNEFFNKNMKFLLIFILNCFLKACRSYEKSKMSSLMKGEPKNPRELPLDPILSNPRKIFNFPAPLIQLNPKLHPIFM